MTTHGYAYVPYTSPAHNDALENFEVVSLYYAEADFDFESPVAILIEDRALRTHENAALIEAANGQVFETTEDLLNHLNQPK